MGRKESWTQTWIPTIQQLQPRRTVRTTPSNWELEGCWRWCGLILILHTRTCSPPHTREWTHWYTALDSKCVFTLCLHRHLHMQARNYSGTSHATVLRVLSAFPVLIAIFRQFSNLAAKIRFYVKLDIIHCLSRRAQVSLFLRRKKRRDYELVISVIPKGQLLF